MIRKKVHYLGRVVAPDREAAIDKAMEEFRIDPARRFRRDRGAGRMTLRSRPVVGRRAPVTLSYMNVWTISNLIGHLAISPRGPGR